ncbi:MAG: hypothetical protein HPY90_07710 [Syntrophothermus sp.]|uniref:hypothetical protein n=1 Tax=Syntrophothermus sp. TaxID=2736299 RepID=UPI00257A6518|nr:hypothetical protein [Syntrophothermus sp.]NSW83147.1 hypothetical protein [Syntrophothermus sp.]
MQGAEAEAKWAFWDSVHKGKQLSKRHCKPHRRAVYRIMSPDEVIRKVAELGGPTVSRATLTNWERWGLLPQARRGSYGRGKGRWTDYPDGAEFEAYANGVFFRDGVPVDPGSGYTIKQPSRRLAQSARRIGLALLKGPICTGDFKDDRLKSVWEAENRLLQIAIEERNRLLKIIAEDIAPRDFLTRIGALNSMVETMSARVKTLERELPRMLGLDKNDKRLKKGREVAKKSSKEQESLIETYQWVLWFYEVHREALSLMHGLRWASSYLHAKYQEKLAISPYAEVWVEQSGEHRDIYIGLVPVIKPMALEAMKSLVIPIC